MDQLTAHRIELLEAEIRQYRQSLRILSEAVLAGSEHTEALAKQAMEEVLGEPT